MFGISASRLCQPSRPDCNGGTAPEAAREVPCQAACTRAHEPSSVNPIVKSLVDRSMVIADRPVNPIALAACTRAAGRAGVQEDPSPVSAKRGRWGSTGAT